ncbi:hypothetical protein ACH42_13250 [Endozoicomonas sp. (ex Bugula neritina AB1)]|nr:hypothetical protein ACH42_13250 [Endozoicomonas sp. (ex Bugula neritina AB1)]
MNIINRFTLRTILGLSLILPMSSIHAEVTKEDKVKAAIVFKMTKFITWPQKKQTLTLCIIGDGSINSELKKINRKFSLGRRISVTHKAHTAPLEKLCELIYIHNADNKTTQAILNKLKNTPVLTISDIEQFAEQGGVIGLYRTGSRIRFAINRGSAKNSKLSISSQLLDLAKIVE